MYNFQWNSLKFVAFPPFKRQKHTVCSHLQTFAIQFILLDKAFVSKMNYLLFFGVKWNELDTLFIFCILLEGDIFKVYCLVESNMHKAHKCVYSHSQHKHYINFRMQLSSCKLAKSLWNSITLNENEWTQTNIYILRSEKKGRKKKYHLYVYIDRRDRGKCKRQKKHSKL